MNWPQVNLVKDNDNLLTFPQYFQEMEESRLLAEYNVTLKYIQLSLVYEPGAFEVTGR
jgi:hypothetical protein